MLDMRELATASPQSLRAGLSPIVEQYSAWLDGEEVRARELPEHLRDEGLDAVSEARKVQRQLADGLEHLLADDDALRCFRFMNEVMADQRVQSQVARRRTQHPRESIDAARDAVLTGTDKPHSWFTFQLAFILMQLPLLTDPAADKRSGDLAKAQLLFFPTGGGKTEAYLGLAAYAFAIRRLQGVAGDPGRPARRARRRDRADAVHAAAADRAAVPARDCAGVRGGDGTAARRGHLGHRTVPDRAVGRDRCVPETVRRGRGPAQAGRQLGWRLPADRAADPAVPLVRYPDRGGQCEARSREPADLRVLRGRTGRLPVREGRRRSGGSAGPHRGRGDLPARARVRDRDRRQVRAARAGRRGGVPVRLRVEALRPARLRPPRLSALHHQGRQQAPEVLRQPCTRSPVSGRPT